MNRLPTSLVRDQHTYTHSDVPWLITIGETAYGKMINYISGGGMRTFGRTVRQERSRRHQRRFLLTAGILTVVWLLLYIV